MGLNIKSPRVEANIRKLAQRTGASLTEAVDKAVLEQLRRMEDAEQNLGPQVPLAKRLQPLLDELAEKRVDRRKPSAIMDEFYDENGLPQ